MLSATADDELATQHSGSVALTVAAVTHTTEEDDFDLAALAADSPWNSPLASSPSAVLAASGGMSHNASLWDRITSWFAGPAGSSSSHAYSAVELEDRLGGRSPPASSSSSAAIAYPPLPPLPRRSLLFSLALLATLIVLILDRFVIRRPYGFVSWHTLTSTGLYQGAPGTGEQPKSCGWDYEASWKIGQYLSIIALSLMFECTLFSPLALLYRSLACSLIVFISPCCRFSSWIFSSRFPNDDFRFFRSGWIRCCGFCSHYRRSRNRLCQCDARAFLFRS